MKDYFRGFTLLAAITFFALLPSFVNGQRAEQIESFISDITVNKDASINVKETILYDFGAYDKHGIYRDIPIVYKSKSGKSVRLDLSGITVTDEKGSPINFTTSRSGNDRRIKIGDADLLINGVHSYVVSYIVPQAVGFFDAYDEIYWNVTGDGWEVPIREAEASVTVPYSVSSGAEFDNTVKISCYAGPYGSTNECDSTDDAHDPGFPITVGFYQSNLSEHEGLTVAVGFPKGFVTPPTYSEKTASSISSFFAAGWWWFILPILVFIWRYRKWSREGRDPRGTGVIVAQYEAPDALSPMQIKLILDQDFGNSISAEIVYLAEKGFIKIRKIAKAGILRSTDDYELTRLKTDTGMLTIFQASLLNKLFSTAVNNMVSLSDLYNKFYKDSQDVRSQVEKSVIEGGYFAEKKSKKIGASRIWGRIVLNKAGIIMTAIFALIFISVWAGGFIAVSLGEDDVIKFVPAVALSIAIWATFAILMPRLTIKGVAAKEAIKGFKLYLTVAEEDRINFHNAPAKNPETFEKFLPYAMALGVEKEWAKVFKGIELPAPSWYDDPSMKNFNAGVFAASMSSFSSASSQTMSSAPGSSSGSGGGGFSGGGGGGGGGGSW